MEVNCAFQHSAIRGLQEVRISDVQQAECLIARAILKRATAMTGSNSQSSRSQCVINIRANKIDAERERRTGNQSLWEHQKNPKRPLQKHFQSSLLTRILRDFLEGKKRMALILTVKSGEKDYLDSSLLLRQASPYTKIKFENAEEPVNLLCTKRHKQTMSRIEPSKRMKFSPGERVNNDSNGVGDQLHEEEGKKAKKIAPQLPVVHAESTIGLGTSECVYRGERFNGIAKQERNYMIMQKFSKALWNVLKQYKTKLEVAENKIMNLTESLAYEKARSSELKIELKDLKGTLSYGKISSDKEDSCFIDKHAEQVGYQGQSYQGSLSYGGEISSAKEDNISADKSEEEVGHDRQRRQECVKFLGYVDCTEALTGLTYVGKDDTHFNDSGIQKPLVSFPELITIAKESSPEPLTRMEKHSCHSAKRNLTRCDEYKDQEAENQIQHIGEVLVEEDATRSELEINLSCLKEISPIKEDNSVNRTREQVGSHQSDNVHDSSSYEASSLAVDSKSQGKENQECGEFLGDVDCTVALTELIDCGMSCNACVIHLTCNAAL